MQNSYFKIKVFTFTTFFVNLCNVQVLNNEKSLRHHHLNKCHLHLHMEVCKKTMDLLVIGKFVVYIHNYKYISAQSFLQISYNSFRPWSPWSKSSNPMETKVFGCKGGSKGTKCRFRKRSQMEIFGICGISRRRQIQQCSFCRPTFRSV